MKISKLERIEMDELKALSDNDVLKTKQFSIFNYQMKKVKVRMIKFPANNPSVWIFPYKSEELDFSFEFTRPHLGFMASISESQMKEDLESVNKVCRFYYNQRFKRENSNELPSINLFLFCIVLVLLGFFILMMRIKYPQMLAYNTGLQFCTGVLLWSKFNSRCYCHHVDKVRDRYFQEGDLLRKRAGALQTNRRRD